jgi:serine/threonine-protein kinase ULK/ATG1
MASERLFGSGNSPPNYNRLQQTMVGSPRGFLIMGAAGQQQMGSDEDSSSNNKDGDLNDDNRAMLLIEKAACMGHAVAKFADTKFELLVSGRGGVVNESALAAEALVLHLKALALLEFGFEMAKKYWHRRRFSDTQRQESSSRSSAVRLNDAVQWMRERFNECLDRASFEKSKCEQMDPANSDFSGNSTCVEKLLYDRALEMVNSDGNVIFVLTLCFLN